MKHKRLIIVLAVLALVTLVGATAAFASSSATQLSQQTAADDVGLVIVSVDPAGPAAAAGVARGDILISIGGQATNTGQDVTKAVAGLTAGDAVEVVVTHGDEERTLTVTTVDNNGRAYLGIQPY
ncbi:MAG: PDZ domain-containing protein, partial [Anaerolineae bacterium]|nr:PDZ domain-containing protein [Anaerolineae bacterium]